MANPFWDTWPSWIVELTSGLVLSAGAMLLPGSTRLIAATLVSVIYERWFDRNKWSWLDVGQRSIGIACGVTVVNAVHLQSLLLLLR